MHDMYQVCTPAYQADGSNSGLSEERRRAWQPGVANALSLVQRSMLELKSLRYLDRPRCSWMRRTRRTTRASAPGFSLPYCAARSSRVCDAAGVLTPVAFLSLLALQPGSPEACYDIADTLSAAAASVLRQPDAPHKQHGHAITTHRLTATHVFAVTAQVSRRSCYATSVGAHGGGDVAVPVVDCARLRVQAQTLGVRA